MQKIAVLIPCYNESIAIAKVIQDFNRYLPRATVYVYDNGSSDNTIEIATNNGAIVRSVLIRGKGNVVKRMFADIDADVYVLIDGDATYDVTQAQTAIKKLQENALDMVVCARKARHEDAFHPANAFGNKCFTKMVNFLFRQKFQDIFSGYRVFSRRFVKSFPAVSQGFEIEAEITIHALQLGIPWIEFDTAYQARPSGSESKLNPFKDGAKILWTILLLFLQIRPMVLLGLIFILLTASSLCLGMPIIITFFQTGLVPRIPTAILSASLALLASLCLFSGIVLDGISRSRLEAKRFWYLQMSPVTG